MYVYRQHFFVNADFIKHNRHFMSTYFLLDPFEISYYIYRIRRELIYVLSIVVCIPSTFCPNLGPHQGGSITKTPLHSSNMLKQKLHDFCNRSSPDDGPKSGRNYEGYIQLWTIQKSISPEYDKSDTGIRKDPEENM